MYTHCFKRGSKYAIMIQIVLVVAISVTCILPSTAEAMGGRREATMPKADHELCPTAKELAPLIALGSVYLGEVHGTNQGPMLTSCLVDATLAAGIKPLVVSLELPAAARDLKSSIWTGTDGRTSKAMARLVEHLEDLESSHRIVLDFQLSESVSGGAAGDRVVGLHLRNLASKSRVIALGGNFHSQRKNVLMPSLGYKTAGDYVGSSMKTVFLDSTGKGHAWFCSNTCDDHVASNMTDDGEIGRLVDGAAAGHDYIYKVGPFTSSSPSLERPIGLKK